MFLICLFIVLIFVLIFYSKKESYYTVRGKFIEEPFATYNDKKCRKKCENIKSCSDYTYDSFRDRCLLHDYNGGYLNGYSNDPERLFLIF